MTPPLALAMNATPPSAPSVPVSAGNSSSDGKSPSAFAAPLQQARQQQSAQRPSTSTHTASTANASTTPSPSTPSTAAAASTSTPTSKPWNPAGEDAKNNDKQATSTDANPPTSAAAAMLALLGQSIPANAAPVPAASGSGNAAAASTAVTATAIQVSGMPSLPLAGAAQASAQPDADDSVDASKANGGLKDSALSALAGDADDDTTPMTTTGLAAVAKLATASQATPATASQNDRSDPLDALRNLTAPFVQAQPSAQIAATPHAMTMNASVGTPSFAQELGQHVAWLGGQDIKEARITLHPEDLGQLEVKVSVLHDHVDVSFIAQHPNAVHAVQQTLSQLDSMLAHHGLSLGQAQVEQGNHGGGAGQGATPGSAGSSDAGAADDGDVAQVVAPVVQALGLLDTFA